MVAEETVSLVPAETVFGVVMLQAASVSMENMSISAIIVGKSFLFLNFILNTSRVWFDGLIIHGIRCSISENELRKIRRIYEKAAGIFGSFQIMNSDVTY